jgi:hypothetical protein
MRHAGENPAAVLARGNTDLPAPIQVCDVEQVPDQTDTRAKILRITKRGHVTRDVGGDETGNAFNRYREA